MLARAFLRFCALEALRPSALLASNGPWPTDAGPYVSDSRIDPIDDVEFEERRPIVAVFTEGTHLTKIAQAGPQFYRGDVDLVFEISVVMKFPVEGGGEIIDFADTDAKLEARLDRLEDQILFCLNFGPSGALFRQMAKLPFDDWDSAPHRSGEESARLARRTIRAKIRMKETCYEGVPDGPRANLNRLPPALKAIAVQLGESSYLADLALDIAQTASVMPVRVDLNGVALKIVNSDLDISMVDVTAEIESAFAVKQTIATGGPVQIDYSRGTFQLLTLAASVADMSIVNWPAPGRTARLVLQITNAGAFGISSWPIGTVWAGGVPPIITLGANKRDIVVLTSQDGGATVFGSVVGQNYQ